MSAGFTVRLDFEESDFSLILKRFTLQEYTTFMASTDDDGDENLSYAELLAPLLEQVQVKLEFETQVAFRPLLIELNHFNGTGYHYQDMSITITGLEEVIQSPVDGYIAYHFDEDGYRSYLYSFHRRDGKTAYLAILHREGPGYGQEVETILALLFPDGITDS
jgi:hypothetical protein